MCAHARAMSYLVRKFLAYIWYCMATQARGRVAAQCQGYEVESAARRRSAACSDQTECGRVKCGAVGGTVGGGGLNWVIG